AAAPRSRSVLAIDLNPDAIHTTRRNAERLGIENLETRRLDLTREAVAGSFEVVLCGPPFSEVQLDDVRQRWAGARAFTPLVFARAEEWLHAGGTLIVHHLANAGARLEALGLRHGFRLREARPNHEKPLRLQLLALLYAQVGLRTAFYVFERTADDEPSIAST
ncbi:MAG: methyltransferase, partial [Myxococcota bacterium]